jgi:hypothetical protein
VVLRLNAFINKKLDMEFSLDIELKIAYVDTGYFVGLTPGGKFSNSIWESQEMNSHQR